MRYGPKPLSIYAIKNTTTEKKSTSTHKTMIYEEIRSTLYEKSKEVQSFLDQVLTPKPKPLNLVTPFSLTSLNPMKNPISLTKKDP